MEECVAHHVEQAKIFVIDAGKVDYDHQSYPLGIKFIWARDRMHEAGIKYQQQLRQHTLRDTLQLKRIMQILKLENSYVGIIGKSLEPVIKPSAMTGDWDSDRNFFAAREVFVGTMATL